MQDLNWQRRRLLQLAALSCLPLRPALAADRAPLTLRAAAADHPVDAQLPASALWLYNGKLPGPVLRVPQHGRLRVRFVNDTPEPSAVHWHGLRIDNAMDGAAGLTQALVPPGGSFDYELRPPDAGTFWYHPHGKSWQEQARGLSGALIVDEPEPPALDADLPVLLDDWLLDGDGKLELRRFGNRHDAAHAGRLGNWLSANGHSPLLQPVPQRGAVRLRLINVCNSRTLQLRLDAPAWLIAEDGQPLSHPQPLSGETLTLAVGQRVDLSLSGPEAGAAIVLSEVSGDAPYPAVRLVGAEARGRHTLDGPLALPANPLPTELQLGGAQSVRLHMSGGAMSQRGMQGMMGGGGIWQFNGVGGMPDDPWFRVRRGSTVVAELVNDTRFPHAMHLHGHHFQVLESDARPPAYPSWRDTLLMQAGERARIAFVADNPGRWMAHCHMLEHQMSGMMTWFDVETNA